MIQFLRKGGFRRNVASFVTIIYLHSLVIMPVWADSISDAAARGKQVGAEIFGMQSLPTADGSTAIKMFPDSANPTSVQLKDIFPGSSAGSISDYQNAYGDDAKTINQGNTANQTLSTEQSATGDAYRLLDKQAASSRPNLSNDPVIRNSATIHNGLEVFQKSFTDCKTQTTIKESANSAHIPTYKTCEKVNKPEGDKTLQHDYSFILPVEISDGQASTESCGAGCLYVYLGRVGDNYLSGNCTVFEFAGNIQVNKPAAIISATIDNAQWDDYMQIFVGYNKIWSGPNGDFPPETSGSCELGASWNQNPNVDVTSVLKQGGLIPFKIRISVTGNGEGYARIKLLYDAEPVRITDKWYSDDAVNAAQAVSDGFCTGSNLVCTDMPVLDDNGCTISNGVTVCPSNVVASPYPNLNPLCRKATFTSQCSFNEGQMSCYKDAKGNTVCPVNGGSSCSVSHLLDIEETIGNANLAAQGRANAVFDFDLANGTWLQRASSDGAAFQGTVDKIDFNKVCGSAGGGDPKYTGNQPWTGFSWGGYVDSNVNVAVLQQPTCANGLKGAVQIQDTQSNTGLDAVLSVGLRYKFLSIRNEEWGHSSCVDAAQKAGTASCPNGTLTVTAGPSTSSGCTTISGVNVCPGDPLYNHMQASPIPGIDKLVESVRVDGCITDPTLNDSCQTLQTNPNCGFISSTCVGGAEGQSGNCYVSEEKWDCGTNVDIPNYKKTEAVTCGGEVRCLGKECSTQGEQSSPDFAQAVAALQVAQFAGHDLNCSNDQTNVTGQSSNCTIFKGDPLECKKAVGGWVNCCDKPSMVSLADYVTLTMNTYRVMEATGALQGVTTAVAGEWSTLTQPVLDAFPSVTKAFSSAADSIAGTAAKDATEGVVKQSVFAQAEQALMKKAAEWTAQTFGEGAAGALFTTTTTTTANNGATTSTTSAYSSGTAAGAEGTAGTAGSAAAEGTTTTVGFNSALASAASVVMWVYTIYVIVDLLINMIYECEQSEFELASKKEVLTCHHVGSYCSQKSLGACIEKRESYCCFNSPVARILQEQIREQIGPDWGEPNSPNCVGVPVNDMQKVDWSKVDLSEWMAILKITGNYPTPDKMGLDNLTGSGSPLNANGDRANAVDRTQDRVQNLDAADLRERAAKSLQ